ncbi:MAG TPA: hypothetical protein VI703_10810 [Anaerolineales bacterium]|nr:hypothetical protein [Anaerolineales bacterium]
MNLSAPKQLTFWVAVILGVLGIVGTYVTLPFVSAYAFWLLVVGFVLLALGNMMEGL